MFFPGDPKSARYPNFGYISANAMAGSGFTGYLPKIQTKHWISGLTLFDMDVISITLKFFDF